MNKEESLKTIECYSLTTDRRPDIVVVEKGKQETKIINITISGEAQITKKI